MDWAYNGPMHRVAWLVCLSGCQLVFPLSPAASDAPGEGDAPDGGPPKACTTRASSLVDPLRDSLRPSWVSFKSVDNPSLTAVSGPTGLVLTPGVGGLVGVYSLFAYDLDSSRIGVRFEVNTTATEDHRVRFGLLEPAPRSGEAPGVAHSYEWTLENNKLVATFFDGITRGSVGVGMDYEPLVHQHLGFSRSDDTLRWEVSTDGTTFTAMFEQAMPAFRMVRPYMQDERGNSVATPVVPTFSDLNSQITQAEACPAAALQTTFDQEDTFSWHALRVDGCRITVADGAATMAVDQAANFRCEYASTGVYQLIGGSFDVALRPLQLTEDGDELYVDIESFALARVTLRIHRENGLLRVGGLAQPSPTTNIETVFAAAEAGERFFRFTGSLDLNNKHKVTLFTSLNGVDFVKRGEFAGLEGFEKARVVLGGIGISPIVFDGVGTPP